MHEQPPERIFRRGDQHVFPFGNGLRDDGVSVVGDGSAHAVLQTLRAGKLAMKLQAPVADRPQQRLAEGVANVLHLKAAT